MKKTVRRLIAAGIVITATIVFRFCYSPDDSPYKVNIAFGFHTNTYHSFRIDTNDEAGFGKDLRIIRKTLATLDEYNRIGVPVKGTWDFDNLFTLCETLPRHAPDIIESVRRRIRENGDEVILMSYGNALMAAVTREEFRAEVGRAITNEDGCGVRDIFKTFTPIVRPQEMMTTPGSFKLYREFGIQAVTLYYSAIPFDAIRAFVPPLKDFEALNPLQYENPETDEKFIVIPAYNHGDIIENGSLRLWVINLRKKQISGEIKGDVLIYINLDADDPFWYGYDLPWYYRWLPNAGGLKRLIAGVSELPYVQFTSVGNYLKSHKPVGKVTFGQDTADGNFTGFQSWAEKASSQRLWKAVEEDRGNHHLTRNAFAMLKKPLPQNVESRLAISFQSRLRLLSTTHFGIAGPFLAKEREAAADRLGAAMLRQSRAAWKAAVEALRSRLRNADPPPDDACGRYIDSFVPLSRSALTGGHGGLFVKITLPQSVIPDSGAYRICGDNGAVLRARTVHGSGGAETIIILDAPGLEEGKIYHLFADTAVSSGRASGGEKVKAATSLIRNEEIEVRLSTIGHVSGVNFNGQKLLDAGSFVPYIRYKKGPSNYIVIPDSLNVSVEKNGTTDVASVRVTGAFPAPPVPGAEQGSVDYRFTLVAGAPYLFVNGLISYPSTPRVNLYEKDDPALVRAYDNGWREVAPVELRLTDRATPASPFRVWKSNYLGVSSSYMLDYFHRSKENLNIDAVNNHVTAEYAALSAPGAGVAIGADTTVWTSFAFAPLKISFEDESSSFSAKMNPFGTYYGKQLRQPSWGDGTGYDVSQLAGLHYESAAPTFNGQAHPFSLIIAFYAAQKPPQSVLRVLKDFARPFKAVFLKTRSEEPPAFETQPPPDTFFAVSDKNGVYLHWEPVRGAADYEIAYGAAETTDRKVIRTPDFHIFIDGLLPNVTYEAKIRSITRNGAMSAASNKISFKHLPRRKPPVPDLPLYLKMRMIFSGIAHTVSVLIS